MEKRGSVRVVSKKAYNCLQKVFCCRFMHCCQANDESLLTSKDRKSMFIKLAKRYEQTLSKHDEVKPFHMLMTLFIENGELYSEMMEKVRIHSSCRHSREDLEFYVPQLCTYLVFHEEMHSPELINLLERACKLDLHFAHRFYLYLNSLAVVGSSHYVVAKYLDRLMKIMVAKWNLSEELQHPAGDIVNQYHFRHLKQTDKPFPKLDTFEVKSVYKSLYHYPLRAAYEENNIFAPTLDFLKDLVTLSERLASKPNRREYLVGYLSKINEKLPALIHLPLHKSMQCHYVDTIREKTVLNILYEYSKIFATKERAPYSIILELYYDASQHQKGPIPVLSEVTKRLRKEDYKYIGTIQYIDLVTPRCGPDDSCTSESLKQDSEAASPEKKPNKFHMLNKFFKLRRKNKGAIQLAEYKPHEYRKESEAEVEPYMPEIFSEAPSHRFNRIAKYSPYSKLPQYELVTLIVKSNDNLKQEQFAMQLLQMFKDIFQAETIPLELYAYEIVSISHNSGIIEFMDDCLTIDELKRRDSSLAEVVQGRERLRRFIRSLAAYSLVTYLLQVKDRHNGNIMICRDGSLRHIDYGFFISNSPGKGVYIEKNVPFKLPGYYVEVLGGLDSKHFQEFRKLFYQGFNALRKHQDRILILVNLMYSSHGTTMPCFERGYQCIQELERRFNPESIHTDAELSVFCQGLINASVDNWRARWYDKWQYVAQGILY